MRPGPRPPRVIGRAACGAALALACGCGPSPITAGRIEAAIGPVFANLVHLQLSRIGLTPLAAADLSVTPACRPLVPGRGDRGAGEWVCSFAWHGPNEVPLHDTYDVVVAPDGCYTASVEGPEGNLGGPAITAPDGRQLRNLLYTFEGCFDPSR